MIMLKQKDTGVIKECATGYSWTTFFFGAFVPLVRGDLKWAGILFALCLLAGILTMGFGAFLVPPIFAVFYNKVYIKDLVEKGYAPTDEAGKLFLIGNGIIAPTAFATEATPNTTTPPTAE